MQDSGSENRPEIHEFDPLNSKSLPDISGIVYADDQDPSILTDAGLLAEYYVKVLERLFVGERMASVSMEIEREHAGRIRTLVPGELPTLSLSIVKHNGAAEFVDLAVRTLGLEHLWRGTARLSNIANRILLGRAKTRLLNSPEDGHATRILEKTRLALTTSRHP